MKNNYKIKVILQARLLSNRLKCKSLLPISNIPLALLCAKRLGNTGYPVIVAIPNNKTDDVLYEILKKKKLMYLEVATLMFLIGI